MLLLENHCPHCGDGSGPYCAACYDAQLKAILREGRSQAAKVPKMPSHKQNIAKLKKAEAEAEEAMRFFNRAFHSLFTEGYAIAWMHNGNLQEGLVQRVLGYAESGLNASRLSVLNTRTGRTVEVNFYQILQAEKFLRPEG